MAADVEMAAEIKVESHVNDNQDDEAEDHHRGTSNKTVRSTQRNKTEDLRLRCLDCLHHSPDHPDVNRASPTPDLNPADEESCSICGKEILQDEGLKVNSTLGTNMKMYHCSECPKWCRSNSDLKKHLQTHNGDTPYFCGVCQKGFRSSRSLCRHTRSHEGREKLLQCFYCDKRFEYNCEREKHMRTHTGDRPYRCPQCHMAFGLSCNLRRHMKTHNSDETFLCPDCNKCFTSKRSLSRHFKLIHSGDTSHKCKLCGMGFPCSQYLVKHMKKHARGKIACDPVAAMAAMKEKLDSSAMLTSSNDLDESSPFDIDSLTYKCYVCHLLFSTQEEVIAHLETHDIQNNSIFPGMQPKKTDETVPNIKVPNVTVSEETSSNVETDTEESADSP